MSPREAVCQYANWEFSEASDYRYHYGRTSGPIYTTATGYICAVANGKKPHAYNGLMWREATGSTAEFIKSQGQTVYTATGEIAD